MSPVNCGVTRPNFTKFSHDIQVSFVHTEVVISHSVSECQSNENWKFAFLTKSVAMAMSLRYQIRGPDRSSALKTLSLDKLENKVMIHHLHIKRFHTVKRL